MSKVIKDSIDFVVLFWVIGQENSSHFLNELDAKLVLKQPWSPSLPCSLSSWLVFTLASSYIFLCFNWPCCFTLWFGFWTLNRKFKEFNSGQPYALSPSPPTHPWRKKISSDSLHSRLSDCDTLTT